MTRRPFVPSTSTTTLVCLVLLLFPAALAAQERDDEVPGRPDGRPDLSGTYDIATLTPLVRPAKYGNRLTLTDEEARAIAEHWQGNFEKDFEPSDPEREAPPEGGTGIYAPEFTGAAGKVGGYNAFYVDIGEGAFQLDGKWRTSIITDPPDGQRPPLSEEGQEKMAKASQYRHENTGSAWWIDMETGPYDDPELRPLAERCLMARSAAGPPVLPGMYNNVKRIVQTDEHLMINIEWMHDTRIIPIVPADQAKLEDAAMPRWLGNSVAHWDGDTLVVETAGFVEDTAATATAHPERRIVERFSRIDENALRYEFTVYDPNHAETWSGEYPWPATQHRMYEYACHEGNYALGGILRGARLLESEALEGKVDSED